MYSRFLYQFTAYCVASVATADDDFYDVGGLLANDITYLFNGLSLKLKFIYFFRLLAAYSRHCPQCRAKDTQGERANDRVVWEINANEVKKRAILLNQTKKKEIFSRFGKLTEIKYKIRLKTIAWNTYIKYLMHNCAFNVAGR